MSNRMFLSLPVAGYLVAACSGAPAVEESPATVAETPTEEEMMNHTDADEVTVTQEHHGAGHHGHGAGHHGEGHHGAHGEPMAGHQHRFDDPAAYAARWESPERDAWQMPDELVAALEIEPGMTVADIGTGTGYLLGRLSAAAGDAGRVYAIDVEQAMIDWVTTRASDEGWANVQPLLAPFDGPGVEASSLDRAVTVNVWHHIEDRSAYAAAMFDAVKSGGTFVVVETKLDADAGPPVHYRLAPEAVMEELSAAGFDVELSTYENVQQYAVVGRRP